MNKKYIVKQQDIKDCGVCCLQSIIKYYNGYIPLETLRLDTKTNTNGTTAFNLIKAAHKYGFSALGLELKELEDKAIILPAIAHIITKNNITHFVVIYKIKDKYVYVMDPAKGFLKIEKKEFLKTWTNIILIFKPYKRIPFYKIKNNFKQLFIRIASEEKELIIKIAITNIIIIILSIVSSYYLKIIIGSLDNSFITETLTIMIIFLIINIIKIFITYIKNELSNYLSKNIDLTIIPDFINHIFKLPLSAIVSRSGGELLTRIDELYNVKELFNELFIINLNNILLSIISIIFLYGINNKLFLILLIISVLYTLIGIITNNPIYEKINENIDYETEFNSNLNENINNIESIKNLNLTNKIIDKLEYSFTSYVDNTFNFKNYMNTLLIIKNLLYDLGLFIINSYAIYLISIQKLDLLSLITFNAIAPLFIDPLKETIDMLPKYHIIKLSIDKISDFLNIDEELIGERTKLDNGDIEFKNITYSYNNYNNVFENVNLKISKNSKITIKGKTGCGKSTLFKMLNRNIEDYKGDITINNINIKDYSLRTLRENIIYVSQREKLFTGTLKENITLGKTIPISKLNEVMALTKVDEILDKKEMRLDSTIYASGYNLSGGERQRIVLARALLLFPKILILDESLSEIDSVKEKEILCNIKTYLNNTTIIYITHTNNYLEDLIEMDTIINAI